MSLNHVIFACAALITISSSGTNGAQPAPVVEAGTPANQTVPVVDREPVAPPVVAPPATLEDPVIAERAAVSALPSPGGTAAVPAAEHEATAVEDDAATAQEYKRLKMDEATAADDRFHANRTQANMLARDKAEAEAAAAIGHAHAAAQRAKAARDNQATSDNPR